MPNVGPIEIIVVLLILLVIFGPKRIPELGRSVGQGMRNFKQSVTGRDRDDERPELERDRTRAPESAERAPAEAEAIGAGAEPHGGVTAAPESARAAERPREPGA